MICFVLGLAAPKLLLLGSKSKLIVLTYHRVIPPEHVDFKYEQPGMIVTPETFEMHMKILAQEFEVWVLSTWIEAYKTNKPLPKLAFAITFDDGWRDNFDYALPVLKKYNLPATIFLTTEFVGSGRSFWPNRLGRILSDPSWDSIKSHENCAWLYELVADTSVLDAVILTSDAIDNVIMACKKLPDAEITSYLDNMEPLLQTKGKQSETRDMLTWGETFAMRDCGLFEFGSHTKNHVRLSKHLTNSILYKEIVESKNDLVKQLGTKINLFCYPNGDWDNEVKQEVRENYTAACSTVKGLNADPADIYLLKRIGMHEGVSSNKYKFLSRLSGLV